MDNSEQSKDAAEAPTKSDSASSETIAEKADDQAPCEEPDASAGAPRSEAAINVAEEMKPADEAKGAQLSQKDLKDADEPIEQSPLPPEISDETALAEWSETKFCINCDNDRPLPTNPDVIRNIEKVTSGKLVCCSRCHRSN